MKKLLSMALALAMVCSFAACSNNQTPSNSNPPSPPSQPGSASSDASTSTVPKDVKAAWPTGDVRILVPNAAGGASDLAARLFADYVSKESGKNVVVVNETGGNNTVAFETVKNAKNDGSVLLSFHGSAHLNYLAGKIEYSILDESVYTFINTFYDPQPESVNVVAVNANAPWQTIEEFLDDAKANPSTISVGDGFGSSAAVFSGQVELACGVKFRHVDAPDTTTRITNIIGGQIDWAPLGYAQAKPYVESGDIRMLAMDRDYMFDENVPTFESLGYTGVGFTSVGFVAGPAGMDQSIVDAIDAWCQEFTQNEECKTSVEALGFTCITKTREEALAEQAEIFENTKKTTDALGW